jgi:hypothetical protein
MELQSAATASHDFWFHQWNFSLLPPHPMNSGAISGTSACCHSIPWLLVPSVQLQPAATASHDFWFHQCNFSLLPPHPMTSGAISIFFLQYCGELSGSGLDLRRIDGLCGLCPFLWETDSISRLLHGGRNWEVKRCHIIQRRDLNRHILFYLLVLGKLFRYPLTKSPYGPTCPLNICLLFLYLRLWTVRNSLL